MLLEVASPGRWHLDPKAQRQRWDPLASPGSASTGKAHLENQKLQEQYCRLAEQEESGGTE